MRSLPWLVNKNEEDPPQKRNLKWKRDPEPEEVVMEKSKVEVAEVTEDSDSDETAVLSNSADHAFDAMVAGYDNDDAYIMVEHDLLEAAKQVTRHVHPGELRRRRWPSWPIL